MTVLKLIKMNKLIQVYIIDSKLYNKVLGISREE